MSRIKFWIVMATITFAVRAAMALEEAYEFDHPADPLSR